MKIEVIKVSEIIPASYNPRQMTEKQFNDLKESVKKFGCTEPLLINKHKGRENILISGHQRLKVIKELGINEVDVIFLDLTEKQERELNIRLNKNLGEFDIDLLANEFEVEELIDYGFTNKDLGMDDFKEKKKKVCPECGAEL